MTIELSTERLGGEFSIPGALYLSIIMLCH